MFAYWVSQFHNFVLDKIINTYQAVVEQIELILKTLLSNEILILFAKKVGSVLTDPTAQFRFKHFRFRRQVMLDGEKEIAVNQYQRLFKHIKKIQLEKYYKVTKLFGFFEVQNLHFQILRLC